MEKIEQKIPVILTEYLSLIENLPHFVIILQGDETIYELESEELQEDKNNPPPRGR